MSLVRTLGSFVSILSIMVFATPAFADAISPDESACVSKKAGDACTVDTAPPLTGVCTTSTCTKLTYLPDGGHGSSDSPCLICEGSDGGSAADAGPHPTTGDAGTPTGTNSSSSCSMAVAKKNANAAAPLLIAGLIPLVLRRRNKKKAA